MIKLNIKRTNITASCLETLVEGNVNSVFAEFIFSPEWDNLSRIAIFSNGTSKVSVSLSENTCAIPWEMLSCPGELLVAVRGIGNGGNLVICTENASLGKVADSLADDDAAAPEEASPNVIDTLISDVADLKSSGGNGKSAYELAVDAGFEGTQEQWLESLHGADGINGADGYTPIKGDDYWTAADKAEIVDDVINEIPTIPTQLSQLSGDSTHRVVTDAEKASWNGKVTKDTQKVEIGSGASASGNFSTAIGYLAKAQNLYAIQIGNGENSEKGSLFVGFGSLGNYMLLGSDGKIPVDRLPIYNGGVE